ncbi:MAG: YXWGXW repeat-containing protein [candidate division Zixibacteria bacterium]|nr:YXWGXW repeat-containing protein [candidate division Zixibacteria bacterium]
MRQKFLALCVLIFLMFFVSGYADMVYIAKKPPQPKAEIITKSPGKEAVWIGGHWKWDSEEFVWVSGHWVKKPQGRWVKGHWKKNKKGYIRIPGHWKKKSTKPVDVKKRKVSHRLAKPAKDKPGHVWVPGHWNKTKHGKIWIKGNWKKK